MRTKYLGEKKGELNKDIPAFSEINHKGEKKNTTQKINFAQGSNYEYDDQFQKQELGDYE